MTRPDLGSTSLAALAPAAESSFALIDFAVVDDGVRFVFQHATTKSRLEFTLASGEVDGAFRRTERCSLSYRTSLARVSELERNELAAIAERLLGLGDLWLSERPNRKLEQIMTATAFPRPRLTFTPQGLLEILAPEIALDRELPGGFRLSAIYPASHLGDGSSHLELVLELSHPERGRLLVEIRKRNDQANAFARSEHFDLSYSTRGSTIAAAGEAACTWLALVLKARDTAALQIEFPLANEDVPDLQRRLAAKPPDRDATLNLAVDAACGQSCNFCSVQELSPAWSASDTRGRLSQLLSDLRSHASAGTRRVRLNGYDPLSFEPILELCNAISELGYERVDVFSPCTRLADASFVDRLLDALPKNVHFRVPIYGSSAEIHDRVVGAPGAFALLERAIDNLVTRLPQDHVRLIGVAVRENLDELLRIAEWGRTRDLYFCPHTAFPSSESPNDRFRESAPRFSEIAAATLRPDHPPLLVSGVPPCVYFRRAHELGLSLDFWFEPPSERPTLPGREYASAPIVHRALPVEHDATVASAVACPHVASCALASACPGEVLRSYADLHGLAELEPVSLRELLARRQTP